MQNSKGVALGQRMMGQDSSIQSSMQSSVICHRCSLPCLIFLSLGLSVLAGGMNRDFGLVANKWVRGAVEGIHYTP